MRTSILATSRPVPGKLLPKLGGAVVVALALPVFLLGGWRVSGWGLGATLWIAAQAIDLLLARVRASAGNLAASGVLAFGLMFKALVVLVVLVAAVAHEPRLALAAALVYGLAYTLELALSLFAYFGAEAR